jgi:hypothetical protein
MLCEQHFTAEVRRDAEEMDFFKVERSDGMKRIFGIRQKTTPDANSKTSLFFPKYPINTIDPHFQEIVQLSRRPAAQPLRRVSMVQSRNSVKNPFFLRFWFSLRLRVPLR